MSAEKAPVDYDVVIVGAGISGINFAYRLQENNPNLRYCIVDGRSEIGGTWSLFKYPGIRSDSDLFTFGFPWRPWTENSSFADGHLIFKYLRESAAQYGIDKKILFHHKVTSMEWSTRNKSWSLNISHNDQSKRMTGRFVLLGTGYYDYEKPLESTIPGLQDFEGITIHPQFWPTDLDYKGKHVVVIGSGATAITLLPNLAKEAAHTTMLQRSPGYIVSIPGEDMFERAAKAILPVTLALRLIRFKWILIPFLMVSLCQWFPNLARKALSKETRAQLPDDIPIDPHFKPNYNPFEQRMCMCPNGDFFECLRSGKASIATGHIDTVTKDTIKLKSGQELHPDIIVTATGLRLKVIGGINVSVDGESLDIGDKFTWKGTMLEDLPNALYAFGYVDASWTLGADATAMMACRLLKEMQKRDTWMIVPRRSEEEKRSMKQVPFLYLKSTYVNSGKNVLPKAGDRPQWRPRSYYWKDMAMARFGDIRTGLEWIKGV
ncbi:putative monooxygenase [Polychaeton citri CBS 116435]|uniref:Monooxygenase n=1 Tax=Polychaeton citri CBS 116435 TaxID=1314669 RepID=A0A9P4QGL4_9PEZI|nr:putative monooxygenase [Polychaeton citri CBS 116435]